MYRHHLKDSNPADCAIHLDFLHNWKSEKAIPDRTNAGDGITVWDRRGGVCCPAFFAISQKNF